MLSLTKRSCVSAVPYIYVINLFHIQFFCSSWNDFSEQTISITEVFHFKTSRLGFSFLPHVSFEVS